MRTVTVDFETEAIEARPHYPPKPVGVSIKWWGKKPRYFAWGHPTKNNATEGEARAAVREAFRADEVVFHNAKFDLDVAETHMRLRPPVTFHDTLLLLFLHNPHARSLGLKETAEALLGEPPSERDAVRDWLVEAKVIRKGQKHGAFIAKAPGDLVGRYANGDTDRTEKLFRLLKEEVSPMAEAYQRELRLLPILLRNEREGVCVDVRALARDVKRYEKAQQVADAWLRKRLKRPELNFDAPKDLADALDSAGVVTEWTLTAAGQRSTAKKVMTSERFGDKRVFAALGYRQRLETCLAVFLRPWLAMAEASGGRIHTNWNQVRGGEGGTRTGRLSCSPNFQNVPKDWYDKNDGYVHPAWLGMPELPRMRRYVLPDKGQAIGHRDYNQQEPRILAHFEDDKLCAAYQADARTDVHSYVQQQIAELTGLDLSRRATKMLNLGLMYGMGLGRLAEGMGVDVETAKKVKAAQRKAVPGLALLEAEVKQRARSGGFVRTWGGRRYFVEPPVTVNGQLRTFEYKLLNYLIQGSAADCTKEALIRYESLRKDGRFMVTVHDELNISAPRRAVREELLRLRQAMESVEFAVPMLSDAKAGLTWGELKSVKEKR